MVNYSKSKIISVGENIHTDSIFSTTNTVINYMKEIRKKFILYKNNEHSFLPIFKYLEANLKPTVTILVEKELKSKEELNLLLESTKIKYYVEPVIGDNKNNKKVTNKRNDSNLKLVLKYLNVDLKFLIEHPQDGVDMILKLENKKDNTKKNYIKAIIPKIQTINIVAIRIYNEGLTKLQNELNTVIDMQVEKTGLIYKNPTELNEITKNLVENNNSATAIGGPNLLDAVISVFYTGFHLPVSRLLEVYTLKISNYSIDTDNYIDFTNKCIIFNDYKTSSLYGKQIVKLNSVVIKLFLKLVKSYTNPSDYLLQNNGNVFTEPTFSKRVKKIFGVTCDDLRSMYFTYHYNAGNLKTEKQKTDFAVKMRNSTSVFKHYITILFLYSLHIVNKNNI
jgi:hypothetical protein